MTVSRHRQERRCLFSQQPRLRKSLASTGSSDISQIEIWWRISEKIYNQNLLEEFGLFFTGIYREETEFFMVSGDIGFTLKS